MINKYLTCEQYLENYNKSDKTVVANLDDSGNILVKEGERWTWDDLGFTRPKYTHNYLVGPIADALHAYEELGYSPEELKKIIEEHKKFKERSLYISSAVNSVYGTLGSPFEKKFREMRENLERGNRIAKLIEDDIYDNPVIKLLHPGKKVADGLQASITLIDEMHAVKPTPTCKTVYRSPKILVERAIFNDPATIVFWKDGTKTVVKAQKGETYDPEKGLAMAFSKKMFGNEGSYYDQFTKLLPKENKVTSADVKAQTFADKLAEDIRDGLKDLYKNIDKKGRGQ